MNNMSYLQRLLKWRQQLFLLLSCLLAFPAMSGEIPGAYILTDLEGNEVRSEEFVGVQPVLLMFWNSW